MVIELLKIFLFLKKKIIQREISVNLHYDIDIFNPFQDKERLLKDESITLMYDGECKAILRNPGISFTDLIYYFFELITLN